MCSFIYDFLGGSEGKASAYNAGAPRLPLGQEDRLEEEMATHSSTFLENPMDRGVWWATVHRVTKNWTWLSIWAYCSWGSQGRNTEVGCHALLQGIFPIQGHRKIQKKNKRISTQINSSVTLDKKPASARFSFSLMWKIDYLLLLFCKIICVDETW